MTPDLTLRGVAHDLRHLLCTIRLTAETLSSSPENDTARKAHRILRAVDRSGGICETLSDSVERRDLPRAKPDCNIASTLHEVADTLCVPTGIEVQIHCDADLLYPDPQNGLFRAVLNLASNALDAISQSGGSSLVLRARPLADQIVVTVEDDGPGLGNVAPGVRAHVGAPPSSGLGLKIADQLTKGLGGDLRVLSTGPGGTRFGLFLPKTPQAMPVETQAEQRPRSPVAR